MSGAALTDSSTYTTELALYFYIEFSERTVMKGHNVPLPNTKFQRTVTGDSSRPLKLSLSGTVSPEASELLSLASSRSTLLTPQNQVLPGNSESPQSAHAGGQYHHHHHRRPPVDQLWTYRDSIDGHDIEAVCVPSSVFVRATARAFQSMNTVVSRRLDVSSAAPAAASSSDASSPSWPVIVCGRDQNQCNIALAPREATDNDTAASRSASMFSRKHFAFVCVPRFGWCVVDIGSSLGVFVNAVRVPVFRHPALAGAGGAQQQEPPEVVVLLRLRRADMLQLGNGGLIRHEVQARIDVLLTGKTDIPTSTTNNKSTQAICLPQENQRFIFNVLSESAPSPLPHAPTPEPLLCINGQKVFCSGDEVDSHVSQTPSMPPAAAAAQKQQLSSSSSSVFLNKDQQPQQQQAQRDSGNKDESQLEQPLFASPNADDAAKLRSQRQEQQQQQQQQNNPLAGRVICKDSQFSNESCANNNNNSINESTNSSVKLLADDKFGLRFRSAGLDIAQLSKKSLGEDAANAENSSSTSTFDQSERRNSDSSYNDVIVSLDDENSEQQLFRPVKKDLEEEQEDDDLPPSIASVHDNNNNNNNYDGDEEDEVSDVFVNPGSSKDQLAGEDTAVTGGGNGVVKQEEQKQPPPSDGIDPVTGLPRFQPAKLLLKRKVKNDDAEKQQQPEPDNLHDRILHRSPAVPSSAKRAKTTTATTTATAAAEDDDAAAMEGNNNDKGKKGKKTAAGTDSPAAAAAGDSPAKRKPMPKPKTAADKLNAKQRKQSKGAKAAEQALMNFIEDAEKTEAEAAAAQRKEKMAPSERIREKLGLAPRQAGETQRELQQEAQKELAVLESAARNGNTNILPGRASDPNLVSQFSSNGGGGDVKRQQKTGAAAADAAGVRRLNNVAALRRTDDDTTNEVTRQYFGGPSLFHGLAEEGHSQPGAAAAIRNNNNNNNNIDNISLSQDDGAVDLNQLSQDHHHHHQQQQQQQKSTSGDSSGSLLQSARSQLIVPGKDVKQSSFHFNSVNAAHNDDDDDDDAESICLGSNSQRRNSQLQGSQRTFAVESFFVDGAAGGDNQQHQQQQQQQEQQPQPADAGDLSSQEMSVGGELFFHRLNARQRRNVSANPAARAAHAAQQLQAQKDAGSQNKVRVVPPASSTTSSQQNQRLLDMDGQLDDNDDFDFDLDDAIQGLDTATKTLRQHQQQQQQQRYTPLKKRNSGGGGNGSSSNDAIANIIGSGLGGTGSKQWTSTFDSVTVQEQSSSQMYKELMCNNTDEQEQQHQQQQQQQQIVLASKHSSQQQVQRERQVRFKNTPIKHVDISSSPSSSGFEHQQQQYHHDHHGDDDDGGNVPLRPKVLSRTSSGAASSSSSTSDRFRQTLEGLQSRGSKLASERSSALTSAAPTQRSTLAGDSLLSERQQEPETFNYLTKFEDISSEIRQLEEEFARLEEAARLQQPGWTEGESRDIEYTRKTLFPKNAGRGQLWWIPDRISKYMFLHQLAGLNFIWRCCTDGAFDDEYAEEWIDPLRLFPGADIVTGGGGSGGRGRLAPDLQMQHDEDNYLAGKKKVVVTPSDNKRKKKTAAAARVSKKKSNNNKTNAPSLSGALMGLGKRNNQDDHDDDDDALSSSSSLNDGNISSCASRSSSGSSSGSDEEEHHFRFSRGRGSGGGSGSFSTSPSGCLLAHMCGSGKSFTCIAFLFCVWDFEKYHLIVSNDPASSSFSTTEERDLVRESLRHATLPVGGGSGRHVAPRRKKNKNGDDDDDNDPASPLASATQTPVSARVSAFYSSSGGGSGNSSDASSPPSAGGAYSSAATFQEMTRPENAFTNAARSLFRSKTNVRTVLCVPTTMLHHWHTELRIWAITCDEEAGGLYIVTGDGSLVGSSGLRMQRRQFSPEGVIRSWARAESRHRSILLISHQALSMLMEPSASGSGAAAAAASAGPKRKAPGGKPKAAPKKKSAAKAPPAKKIAGKRRQRVEPEENDAEEDSDKKKKDDAADGEEDPFLAAARNNREQEQKEDIKNKKKQQQKEDEGKGPSSDDELINLGLGGHNKKAAEGQKGAAAAKEDDDDDDDDFDENVPLVEMMRKNDTISNSSKPKKPSAGRKKSSRRATHDQNDDDDDDDDSSSSDVSRSSSLSSSSSSDNDDSSSSSSDDETDFDDSDDSFNDRRARAKRARAKAAKKKAAGKRSAAAAKKKKTKKSKDEDEDEDDNDEDDDETVAGAGASPVAIKDMDEMDRLALRLLVRECCGILIIDEAQKLCKDKGRPSQLHDNLQTGFDSTRTHKVCLSGTPFLSGPASAAAKPGSDLNRQMQNLLCFLNPAVKGMPQFGSDPSFVLRAMQRRTQRCSLEAVKLYLPTLHRGTVRVPPSREQQLLLERLDRAVAAKQLSGKNKGSMNKTLLRKSIVQHTDFIANYVGRGGGTIEDFVKLMEFERRQQDEDDNNDGGGDGEQQNKPKKPQLATPEYLHWALPALPMHRCPEKMSLAANPGIALACMLVGEEIALNRKTVVFSSSAEQINRMLHYLRNFGLHHNERDPKCTEVAMLTGKDAPEVRQAVAQRFNEKFSYALAEQQQQQQQQQGSSAPASAPVTQPARRKGAAAAQQQQSPQQQERNMMVVLATTIAFGVGIEFSGAQRIIFLDDPGPHEAQLLCRVFRPDLGAVYRPMFGTPARDDTFVTKLHLLTTPRPTPVVVESPRMTQLSNNSAGAGGQSSSAWIPMWNEVAARRYGLEEGLVNQGGNALDHIEDEALAAALRRVVTAHRSTAQIEARRLLAEQQQQQQQHEHIGNIIIASSAVMSEETLREDLEVQEKLSLPAWGYRDDGDYTSLI